MGKVKHANLESMNTLEKQEAMLSLFRPYIRRRERCIRVGYFFGLSIDQYKNYSWDSRFMHLLLS